MMAITGDPSADGLVMEPIEFSLGPLSTPLPGGLVAHVTLDGDVVAHCRVHATLRQRHDKAAVLASPPDALAPATWAAVIARASQPDRGATSPNDAWVQLAAVELERAISHTAWLRALGRVLAWPTLVEATSTALRPLLASRDHIPAGPDQPDTSDTTADAATALLDAAAAHAARLRALSNAKRLRQRAAHRGVVSREAAISMQLTGPPARASGVTADVRTDDPLYRELGFAPSVRQDGDALARTLVRVEELAASISLARAALKRAGRHVDQPPPAATPAASTLEGPRGPLQGQRTPGRWHLSAPGQQAALRAAGEAVVGLEWATALLVLVSFDLSPWVVGP